jgi:5-methylcytosine-specific restriction endonuclease McrA
VKKHTRIYLNDFGYGEQDVILCEICGSPAVDVHHIKYRSRLGKDEIENLMALCRVHHDLAHAEKITEKQLTEIHLKFISYAKR